MIHGHGNEISQYASKIKADFSSNVWYKGPPDGLLYKLSQDVSCITNYPEPDAGSLKEALSAYHGIATNQVMVTNGSTEAFYLIAQAFSKSNSFVLYPCFSEYEDACRMHHHRIAFLENNDNWHRSGFNESLVWFANPNNPDGKTLTLGDIEFLLSNNPSSTFVLDEAYTDLCFGAETAIPLLQFYPNLIIIRSLTKVFSIPGLRLGYIASSEENIRRVSAFLMPWNVNALAIEAGKYLVRHCSGFLPDKASIREETVELQHEIGELGMGSIIPSSCNFFLVKLKEKPASQLKSYLLEEHGLLIRDASNFRGLDVYCARIAIQFPATNKSLVTAMKQWARLC